MTDSTERSLEARSPAASGAPVETLASRALGVMASKRVSAASLLSEHFVDALGDAVRTGDGRARADVVRDMIAARIRPEDIADFYIPEVARRLGAAWCEDGLSFAEVTIGVARLQGLLREIGRDWFRDAHVEPDAAGVLVIVLDDEFHTLGAMVTCAKLGRMGISVRLLMGRNESDVPDVVAAGQFDAVFISAAQGNRVETLRKLVEKIRVSAHRPTPVVIGGSIVTRVADIKTRTGADHATTDAREALRACGLRISARGGGRRVASE